MLGQRYAAFGDSDSFIFQPVFLAKIGRAADLKADLSGGVNHPMPGQGCIFGEFFQRGTNEAGVARQSCQLSQLAVADDSASGYLGENLPDLLGVVGGICHRSTVAVVLCIWGSLLGGRIKKPTHGVGFLIRLSVSAGPITGVRHRRPRWCDR